MLFTNKFKLSVINVPSPLNKQPRFLDTRMTKALILVMAISVALLGFSPDANAQAFSVGMFRPWPGYNVGIGTFLAGDFNGDGRTDLVHIVTNSQYANIWLSNGDGTFTIKQFSPWNGYGMGNGYFIAGDFNGDGKTDLAHIVTNTQYADIWLSNGDGTFTVKQFSPWNGYGMGNGYFIAGDFNGDGKTDLAHIVTNTQYADIWLSNGDGTFTVKQFSPWNGYGMGNGYFIAGDFNGDGKTDLAHIVTNTQYANIWLSNGDGTFTIKQFSPWNGYGMGDGYFIAGDFNGDHKTDLAHIVTNTQYANIWLSNGDGTFTVKQFSPWTGYGMGDGKFVATDLNKDGKTDLVHFVTNTDYANVWLSNGDGSFQVQQFSPWKGYGIGAGYFLTADFNGDGKGDVVHIVSGTDYVHPWSSGLPAPGEFSQDGIEITQAIQDMPHSVPLVANKQAWARAYLSVNAPGPVTVPKATLSVRNLATNLTTQINATSSVVVNPAQNFQLRTKRESLTLSLNFILPPGLSATGTEEFSLSNIGAAAGAPHVCSNCVAGRRTVTFLPSAPLRLRIVGLLYASGIPASFFSPSATDFALLQSWLIRAYPIPQLIATKTTIAANSAWQFSCNQANAQISALRATEVGSGSVDARTHYIGLVANGGGYMRGCASGIPQNPDSTVVASAPTGNPAGPGLVPLNVSGDTDGSFGDWYGGHELDHTLGRYHPGFCNGNSADDPNFPFPNGLISTNDGAFTGLDVGDSANGIPSTVLPGASRFEIMTYCNQPQWLSSYTYSATRSRLGAEDPSAGGAPAGGAGLISGRIVTNSGILLDTGCLCPTVEPSLSVAPGLIISYQGPPIPAIGRDTAPPLPTPAQEIPTPPAPAGQKLEPKPAMPGPPGPQRGADFAPLQADVAPRAAQSQVALKEGRFVNIIASLNLSKGTGKILYVNHVQRAMVPTMAVEPHVSIRLLDRSNSMLGEYPVWVRMDTDIPKGEDQTALIEGPIPDLPNAGAVELLLNDKLLDRLVVPVRAPVVSNLKAVGPRGGIVQLVWEASSADRMKLTYLVQISSDAGKTWNTAAVGLSEPRLEINLEKTGAPLASQARVIANDGYNDSTPVVVSLTASNL
jgi:translation initiation factor IF-1